MFQILVTCSTLCQLILRTLSLRNLLKQLSSVERYALNLMEWSEREWRAEQLRAADAELEAASAGVDATDKLEEMAEEVIRQDRNKSPVEEAPPPPKKVHI